MHPVLFHIVKFPIHSYGFMLALSFLFGIWYSSRRAKKRGLNPNVIADVGFFIIIAAIIGARLYYVILHFEEFRGDLLSIVNPFHHGEMGIGGLVMYGGFIGAIIAGILYFKLKKLPFQPYADAVAPSIAIGVFLTRIGCFLNGCCYGAPTALGLGMHFPRESPAGYYQARLASKVVHDAAQAGGIPAIFPSQLFESAGGLAIAAIVIIAGLKRFFPGFEFYLTGLLYAVLRFLVDFTRYYGPKERLGPLSHNQIVCIALFAVFAGLILRHHLSRAETATLAPPTGNSAPGQASSPQPPANSG